MFWYQRKYKTFVIGRQAALFLEIEKGCDDYFNLKHSCLGRNNKKLVHIPFTGKDANVLILSVFTAAFNFA